MIPICVVGSLIVLGNRIKWYLTAGIPVLLSGVGPLVSIICYLIVNCQFCIEVLISIKYFFLSHASGWHDLFLPFISLKQMEKECIHCKSFYDQKNYYKFTCSHVLHHNCAQETLNNSPGFYGLETISSLFILNCPECKEPVAEEVFDFKSIEDDFSIISKICKEKFFMELHIIECQGDTNKLKTTLSKQMNGICSQEMIFQYNKDNGHLTFFVLCPKLNIIWMFDPLGKSALWNLFTRG